MLDDVRTSLEAAFPKELVKEVLDAYVDAKTNYYQGGHRLSAVEGGRFCEAVFRLLEAKTSGSYTPLAQRLDVGKLSTRLANLPQGSHADSIRLHIPRVLRVVYDIRNNRDTAHLGDGIDPNVQDATLVVSNLDWTMAELLRLHHNVTADEAQVIVDGLVTRQSPVIEDFDGFLKLLRTDLPAGDHALTLLYQRGRAGAAFDELTDWSRPAMRTNLRRTLQRLVDERGFVHRDGDRYFITRSGMESVEERRLALPDSW